MTHFVTFPDGTRSYSGNSRKSSKVFTFAVVAKYGDQPWCCCGYRVDEKQAQALLARRIRFYADYRHGAEFAIVPVQIA